MNCPTLHDLFQAMRRRASETESAEVMAHLSTGCPRCRENHQWLSEIVRLKTEDESFDAPEELIQWSVAQFRVQAAGFAPKPSRLRQLIAELTFDSLTAERLVGVRSELAGAEIAGPRRLLYHVEGYDVDLRFERAKGSASEEMVGQVLPEQKPIAPSDEFTIRLMKDEREVNLSRADANGMFVFSQVPDGVFDLKIEAAEGEILVNRINISRIS